MFAMKRILPAAIMALCAAATAQSAAVPHPSFMCFPPEIKTVGVVMPASILPKKRFDEGIAALTNAGFRVKVAPRMDFRKVATAADRAVDFEEMWMDPDVDLVLCARGGSGSEQILPLLNWARLRTRDQRVLGFSNITMILNAMLKEKAGHLYKKYGAGSYLEIVNKLLQEMQGMGFAECISEQDESFKITSAFHYAEELVNMIQIANEDEIPE